MASVRGVFGPWLGGKQKTGHALCRPKAHSPSRRRARGVQSAQPAVQMFFHAWRQKTPRSLVRPRLGRDAGAHALLARSRKIQRPRTTPSSPSIQAQRALSDEHGAGDQSGTGVLTPGTGHGVRGELRCLDILREPHGTASPLFAATGPGRPAKCQKKGRTGQKRR